jgi:hypothetical protein
MVAANFCGVIVSSKTWARLASIGVASCGGTAWSHDYWKLGADWTEL